MAHEIFCLFNSLVGISWDFLAVEKNFFDNEILIRKKNQK